MTKKLQETLGLADESDFEEEDQSEDGIIDTADAITEIEDATDILQHKLTESDKVNKILCEVEGLDVHDTEMDDIATKAIEAFGNLQDMSDNIQDNYVSRLYEVSATMLNVALHARDSKVNRRLKTIELKMKKMKLDADLGEVKTGGDNSDEIDRNEMLELIRSNMNDKK